MDRRQAQVLCGFQSHHQGGVAARERARGELADGEPRLVGVSTPGRRLLRQPGVDTPPRAPEANWHPVEPRSWHGMEAVKERYNKEEQAVL